MGADDHLGSTRLLSGYSGYPIATYTYGPYGEEFNPQVTINHYKFTGMERDAETGEDHTLFRQYTGTMGRWTTPDPGGQAVVDPYDPQSWNQYAYVSNNPLNSVDPLGLGSWGLDNGPAPSYTVDGVDVPASVALGILNAGAGGVLSGSYTPGLSLNDTGEGYSSFYREARDLTMNCVGRSIESHTCGWSNRSTMFVQDPENDYFTGKARLDHIFDLTYRMSAGPVYGAAVGTLAFAGVAISAFGPEVAAATQASRSQIVFQLGHGMRIAGGHSQVLAYVGPMRNAIATAIASKSYQMMNSESFEGIVNVTGTYIRFTGGWNSTGRMVVSNVMGAALQK